MSWRGVCGSVGIMALAAVWAAPGFAQTRRTPPPPSTPHAEPADKGQQAEQADQAPAGKSAPQTSTDQAEDQAEAASAPQAADSAEGQEASAIGTAARSPDTRGEAVRAYHRALAARKLAAVTDLSRARLRDELVKIEAKQFEGRLDEAIADLVYIVESPRFDAFRQSEEGRAFRFMLGDSLGRVGVYGPARAYLKPLLTESDVSARRAVRSLVDFGLESDQPEVFLKDLSTLGPNTPEALRGDVDYLRARAAERAGQKQQALALYSRVGVRSRFWAQATYLAGLLEVERGDLKRGERLFCKVADPKQTPPEAPLFGGSDFFRVRDLARLGLGRVAHEQYRFDDARYYYYLVPKDSEHLAEALYETATTRYEAKDYEGARESIDELKALAQNHVYQDEAWILDAYIDLASCKFPAADAKLKHFLKEYEPVRDAARRLAKDEAAVERLVRAVTTNADAAAAGLGVSADTARTLGALLRIDTGYGRASRRLAQLDHQLSGLKAAVADLTFAEQRLSEPQQVKPAVTGLLGQTPADKLRTIESQMAELRRVMREAEQTRGANKSQLSALQEELEALELRARAARAAANIEISAPGVKAGEGLDALLARDRERAHGLYRAGVALRASVRAEQLRLAKDALVRLDRRLSRLVRRARLGRIETVLGRKRALELEIEALSQGLLPRSIVDSLDAERYLKDDEEYWPYDGEDWEDEYVGGEGLRD